MKIVFPEEDEVRNNIQRRLSGYFDHSNRLLRYWLEADKSHGLGETTIPLVVLRVLLSLDTKACRQFRSVLELCKRGESVDATLISRSMFETVLVVGFLLKPRFCPREFYKNGKVKSRIAVPGVKLSREFRAKLFLAHQVFQPERFVKTHETRPGMKRSARKMNKIISSDTISESYKTDIGPKWTEILMKHPNSYSGLSISNLARSLGRPFPKWYDEVYGTQSEHVHPADMLHHMRIDEKGVSRPIWHESLEHICGTLQTAITMFLVNIGLLNKYICFGVVVNTALHAFGNDYCGLIKANHQD